MPAIPIMSKFRTKEDKIFDVINLIYLILVFFIMLIPLIYVVSASFSNPNYIASGEVYLLPKGFNIEGYLRVFKNNEIYIGYKNSLLYVVVGTFINLVFTAAAAYPLSKKNLYGKNFFVLIFAGTMFFSGGMIPNYLLIKNLGLINSVWSILLPGAVGFGNVVIMRTFFQTTIPDELNEAAEIDGASNTVVFFRIVFPLSKPVFAVIGLFCAAAHWNQYFHALIYLTDRSKFPLQIFLREILIQNKMSQYISANIETATEQELIIETLRYCVVIVSSIPMLMLYPFLQKYFAQGMMVGAIKG